MKNLISELIIFLLRVQRPKAKIFDLSMILIG